MLDPEKVKNDLLALESNWDSYGARKIDPETLDRALAAAASIEGMGLSIASGGVSLELGGELALDIDFLLGKSDEIKIKKIVPTNIGGVCLDIVGPGRLEMELEFCPDGTIQMHAEYYP